MSSPETEGSNSPHDSILLNSTGISALTFAARCARSKHFSEKVHIYGKPVEENRRLLAGVTLRARTLDYYAAACGVEREDLLSRLYSCDSEEAVTYDQRAAMCMGNPSTGFHFSKKICFMDSNNARRKRPANLPLAYGIRNSRLNRVLQDLAVEAGVVLHNEPGLDAASLRSRACGENPLIVNGTPIPVENTPINHPSTPPSQCVVAVQVPFSAPRIEKRGIIGPHSGFATWVHRDGALDMGVFYPFRDDLSPEAQFYGIVYRIIDGPKGVNKEEEQAYIYDTLVGIGDALGLEPVDPDETKGAACVPVSPWRGTQNLHDGILDISRLTGAGAPIITGDGMTRAAVAGYVGAEALLSGRDTVSEINNALKYYRQINWELSVIMTKFSGIGAFSLRHWPALTLFRNSQTYHRDMWASTH